MLHGIEFEISRGRLVTLLGRNGAGKTTTLRSIMGIVGRRKGSVTFDGRETVGHPEPDRAAHRLCPEERGVFSASASRRNLILPPVVKPGGLSLAEICKLFPISRRGSAARAPSCQAASSRCWRSAASTPQVLLLDEPTEVWRRSSCSASATSSACSGTRLHHPAGRQNFHFAPRSPTGYVVENGRVIDTVDKADVQQNLGKLQTIWSIGHSAGSDRTGQRRLHAMLSLGLSVIFGMLNVINFAMARST